MASTTTAVAGTLAGNLVNSILSSNSNNANAVTILQGLIQNLTAASSINGQRIIAEEILRTPNGGAASTIAEKLLNDLALTDATARTLAVMQDISALNATITVMSHSSNVLAGLLASIGL